MSPSAVSELEHPDEDVAIAHKNGATYSNSLHPTTNGSSPPNRFNKTEFLLGRNLHRSFPVVTKAKGSYLHLADGRTIFDASSGAAVACLGYENKRVTNAISNVLSRGIPYIASAFWSCDVVEQLCKELIDGTGGKMSRVYLTGSGSEAMEATLKLARQIFFEANPETSRVNFIAREGSYHGNTLGALGVSGHVGRRAPYKPFLPINVHHIPACNAYRQRMESESDYSFIARKAAELEAKFQELGPDTVIGFVAEPVVGAALGCVPCPRGYLKAMRDVCHRHGALFILDEVMCGMGRCGTLHAWQEEDVVPDLQTIGKGLGGGYQPIAAVLTSHRVTNVLLDGTGQFIHGQTYQAMPVQAAAALEVQRIVSEEKLLDNVRIQGQYLQSRLNSLLADHPHVGDIRGRGLFWGIEFVKDKKTKEPFELSQDIAQRIHETAISAPFNMTMYPGTGTSDGIKGDHVLLAPPYNITREDVDHIAKVTSDVIHQVFQELGHV